MKLNIQKFQTGASVYMSAAPNPSATLAQSEASTGTTSTKSSSKSTPLISESLLKDLIEKSLPNDNRKFQAMLIDLEQQMERTNRVDKRKLYNVRTYANQIIQQYNSFTKATETAINQGAWDEVAVDQRGYLFTIDESGKLQKTAINKFKADKQQALTVGELAQYRQNSDQLIDRSDIVTAIGNNIGTEKISAYLQSIIQAVGKNETSSEAYQDLASIVGQYAKRPNDAQLAALQGINAELQKLGPDAIFKIKESSSLPNVQAALSYILSVLPPNMRNQLEGRYIASGGDYKNKNEYTKNLVLTALATGTDTKYTFGTDYNEGLNKAAGTSSGTKEDTRRQTTMEAVFNMNANRTSVQISDPNYKNRTGMAVQGVEWGEIPTDSGAGAGRGPLDMVLEAGGKGMAKYLDENKVYFGTDPVSQHTLGKVYYDGDKFAIVFMPVDSEHNIDWESMHAYASAEDYIKAHNITDVLNKNEIHKQYGSPVRFEADGTPTKNSRVEPFFMTTGYTTDDYISSENNMYREVDGDDEDLLDEKIKTINQKFKSDIDDSGIFTDIIKLPIYIRVNPNASVSASYYGHVGDKVPEQTVEQIMFNQAASQQPTMQINGSGMSLFE